MNNRVLVGIPTRERPDYLSCLLTSLLFQDFTEWDLLILDSSESTENLRDHHQVKRLADTMEALGHKVSVDKVSVAGRSEAAAVNRLLVKAVLQEYPFVYKVDDDHILPTNTISNLAKTQGDLAKTKKDTPFIVSGITPWMIKAWQSAAGPESIKPVSELEGPVVDLWVKEDGTLGSSVKHFFRYPEVGCKAIRSKFGSAANFFMKPDLRILWSDLGESSMFADAVWFSQLRKYLGYEIYFRMDTEVWHMAAPAGGVRRGDEKEGELFYKDADEDYLKAEYLAALLKEFGYENRGSND